MTSPGKMVFGDGLTIWTRKARPFMTLPLQHRNLQAPRPVYEPWRAPLLQVNVLGVLPLAHLHGQSGAVGILVLLGQWYPAFGLFCCAGLQDHAPFLQHLRPQFLWQLLGSGERGCRVGTEHADPDRLSGYVKDCERSVL